MKPILIGLALIMLTAMCSAQVYVVMHVQRTTNHSIVVSMPTKGHESWWPAGTHSVERACTLIRDAWRKSGQGNATDVGMIVEGVAFEESYPRIRAMAESEARQYELLYVSGLQAGHVPDLICKEQERLLRDRRK